jgi:hypothetical protein
VRRGSGRSNIYPLAEIERIKEARAAVAAGTPIPERFVNRDGACRMFGVTRHVWKHWIRQGKVSFGQVVGSPEGGKRKLYAVEDLHRLKEALFGEHKVYKGADQYWHVPAG